MCTTEADAATKQDRVGQLGTPGYLEVDNFRRNWYRNMYGQVSHDVESPMSIEITSQAFYICCIV